MNFNTQIPATIQSFASKYMLPVALTTSCYFLPKFIDHYFPNERDGGTYDDLRTKIRWTFDNTFGFGVNNNHIIGEKRISITFENIFISALIYSIAHIAFNWQFTVTEFLLTNYFFTLCLFFVRGLLAFGFIAISRRLNEFPEIADKVRAIATFIATDDLKSRFSKENEKMELDLDELEKKWQVNKPADVRCDAEQLLRLYSFCRRVEKSDELPPLNKDATAEDVNAFVETAQNILRASYDDWYDKYGFDAFRINGNKNYPDMPHEYRDNAVLNIFIDPITQAPIRIPVTVKNKNGGPDYHFERKSILNWLASHATNPIDNTPLTWQELKENEVMRNFIEREILETLKLDAPLNLVYLYGI